MDLRSREMRKEGLVDDIMLDDAIAEQECCRTEQVCAECLY